jgi:putative DNA primase/helicase
MNAEQIGGPLDALEALGARPPDPATVGLLIARMADIEPEMVNWLWPGRIPLGKLTLLSGDPGLGKSFLALDIAARTSAGSSWPDGAPGGVPGNVIIASAEDGAADTIVPRLRNLDADTNRIYAIEGVKTERGRRAASLDTDLERIEIGVRSVQARLLIVDPIGAFLGAADSHRDAEVRAILAPLADMAERLRVAILAVAHLNKAQQVSAIYRTGGSIGFVAAARAVHVLAADKGNRERRIFAPLKNNLSRTAPALAFSITGEPPALEWEAAPAADINVDELLAPDPPRPRGPKPESLERAKDFVQEQLRGSPGPRPVEDVVQAATRAGISESTIRRATKEIGVIRSNSETFPRRSFWQLPNNLTELSEAPVRSRFPRGDTPNTPETWLNCTKSLSEKDFISSVNNLTELSEAPVRSSNTVRSSYLDDRPRRRFEI